MINNCSSPQYKERSSTESQSVCWCDEEAAVGLINRLLQQRGRHNARTRTPLKAILLQGMIRSTFPQLRRVARHFKQILHYSGKNSEVRVNLPFLNMSQTPAGCEDSVPAIMY